MLFRRECVRRFNLRGGFVTKRLTIHTSGGAEDSREIVCVRTGPSGIWTPFPIDHVMANPAERLELQFMQICTFAHYGPLAAPRADRGGSQG